MKLIKCYFDHRLGHIGDNKIIRLETNKLLSLFDSKPYPTCKSCLQGKMIRSPVKSKDERSKELLGLILSDVCGPFSKMVKKAFQYLITFIDDYSRHRCVYLIKYKSKPLEKFREFKTKVEKQSKKNNKSL